VPVAAAEGLNLHGTHVGDEGLMSLKDLSTLTTLTATKTNVTDAGAEKLQGLLSKCKITWK
jgi:hypothetical protein